MSAVLRRRVKNIACAVKGSRHNFMKFWSKQDVKECWLGMCAEVAEVSHPMLNLSQHQVEILRQNLEGLSKGQKVGENMDCPAVNGEVRWRLM